MGEEVIRRDALVGLVVDGWMDGWIDSFIDFISLGFQTPCEEVFGRLHFVLIVVFPCIYIYIFFFMGI